jgi:hypothetical protein
LFLWRRAVLGLLIDLREENLAKRIVVNSILEPARDISDCDVDSLLLPFCSDSPDVIVQVVGEFEFSLVEVVQGQSLKEDSVCLDVVRVDW